MKLTVIGFWGAYPEANGATSGYLLEKDGFFCLIDCGSGVLSRLQNVIKPADLDAVILSHYHHDHIADVGPLQYAFLIHHQLHHSNLVLPIYGHEDDQESFDRLTHHYTRKEAYDPDRGLQLGPFQFDFIKTRHPAPCYAMRISDGKQTVVYTADTSYFPELTSFSANADLLIAESSFYKGMDGRGAGHMNSIECGRLAEEAGVKELWLTHLPHFGNVSQLKQEAQEVFSGKTKLAEERLVWFGE
ncbi:ribonuclease BN (tRNA processing enzyme) [Melghiribacillus thermohalophilus]|uniref:Ribonuclease BN (tRNA processing enzyme) n=1 Tax=Melghiribacillus thermohalophilus TaxID=1324956 RepID=A0A4R3N3H6_9BACI|nr:MBL fold metallo-hydrolase [Melghiribacillus thermohalophilus]TCT23688.1 ribonuclease BN (tRNA processing enzyme) [Melghiribacillus thermohalophilus]